MLESVIFLRKRLSFSSFELSSVGFSGQIDALEQADLFHLLNAADVLTEVFLVEDDSSIEPTEAERYLEQSISLSIATGSLPYYEDFELFISGNIYETNVKGHYIHSIGFREDDSNLLSKEYSNYKSCIDFVDILRLVADYEKRESNTLELFFYRSDSGATLKIDYGSADLVSISPSEMDEIKAHFIENVDAQERKVIFKNELINLITVKPDYPHLLQNWSSLLRNYQKSFHLYLEGFSFEKVISTSDEFFHGISDKIQDTIGKVSNYIFAAPIAYILLLRYFEFDGSNKIGDFILLIIGLLFLILIWFIPLKNISESIDSVSDEIKRFREKIKNIQPLADVIQKLDSLEDRLKGQRRKLVLARVIIITIFLMVVGAFLYIHYGDEIVTLYYNHIVKQE